MFKREERVSLKLREEEFLCENWESAKRKCMRKREGRHRGWGGAGQRDNFLTLKLRALLPL